MNSSYENVTICIKQVRDLQQHLELESNNTETAGGSEPSTPERPDQSGLNIHIKTLILGSLEVISLFRTVAS